MDKIILLDESVVSQISAGEVVERPVSVVKELVENAIDANASEILISVEDAGKRLIEVSDNGTGINGNQVELALTRHATSKISKAQDLFSINTLGFRGEALASIASVSRMEITSKTVDEPLGTRMRVEGGRVIGKEGIGAVTGTTVIVEDLFYNVPARLKFLKSDITEKSQIEQFVTKYALAYPEIRFIYIYEGKKVLHTNGGNDRKATLSQIHGIELAKQLIEVNFQQENIRIEGFISPITLTRSNRKEINFFINGRLIQDIALNSAIVQAYHTLIMVGRYPIAMLYLKIPTEEIDVNVHPSKAEVRFKKSDVIFSAVQRGVKRALLTFLPLPTFSISSWQGAHYENHERDMLWENEEKSELVLKMANENLPTQKTLQHDAGSPKIPLLKLIGQAGLTYLIAEGPDGLYLIDQHAAHERVLFEKLIKQHDKGLDSQFLLEPVLVDFSASKKAIIESQFEALSHFGFEIELFGESTVRIRAIPTLLFGMDPQSALRVLVEDFEEDETPLQSEQETRIIARVCKSAAVKAGMVLSGEEQMRLLEDLESCDSPRTCPHGRPTMIHISVNLLERQFGRRGAR